MSSVVKVFSDSNHDEFYRRIVGELDVMLENASEIGDLVLAAHLQAVKDFAQERFAQQVITPNRG